jgi:WD40 repeat protein
VVNIECLAFRPDGKRLVGAGTNDKNIVVISWDTGSGKAAQSEKLDADRSNLQLSADGGSLAYTARQRGGYFFRVRDLAAKKNFDVSSEKPIYNSVAFALSPDGKVAGIGDKLWDVTKDKELVTLKKTNELSPQIRRLFFSPDGKLVAAVGDKQRGETNNSIFLYDVKTGLEVFAFKAHEKEIYSLAITRNGQTMASTSGDGTVKLWDLDP